MNKRELNNQEVKQLIADIILTAYYTGARRGELEKLLVENVNLESKIITIGDHRFSTKSRRQRIIPITDKIYEMLESRLRNKSKNEYVFATSKGKLLSGDYISKTFKSACKAAGIDSRIRFHSLRHSFASYLVQQGISIYVLKDLLGHSSITTTEIYSHNNLEGLKEAIKKFN